MLWISFISLFRATLNCFFSPMVSTQERCCFDDLSSAAIYCQLDSVNTNPIGDWREAEKCLWSLYFSSIIPVKSPRLLWLLSESHCGSFMQPSPSNCSLSMTYTLNHCHEPWVVILSLMIPVPFSYICKWSFIKILSNCSNKVATSSPLGLKIKICF